MQEEFSTYPDMAAYHSIAVTLGQAGHLTELLELINSLKAGPKHKRINGYLAQRGNWDGSLQPDIVVYNAVCHRLTFLNLLHSTTDLHSAGLHTS